MNGGRPKENVKNLEGAKEYLSDSKRGPDEEDDTP